MKIRLIWVGKTKEQFILEGIRKYIRLASPYADIIISEIKEEKGKEINKMTEKEGQRIIKLQVPYVLLDEKGKNLTSLEFAAYMGRFPHGINFVVGGAYGVSDMVRETAQDRIALSKMTFTHEMARVFLLEQIYRSFTISQRRGYHH